ncbi:MAG: hypothetical protein CML17_07515 [Pusillimonas sp.]|nr:hypothetical protein [Pusillimonas sp.]
MFGLSAATLAAIGSTAIAAGTTTASFIQAGKQKKAQRRAEREADRKMKQARKKLEMNYMESLSIPLEAYEREMEAIQVQTAQATQAAVEGSQRGVAATAGQVQQVASEAQANQRTAMAEDLFNLEAATAEEASRLRDIGVNLDLAEAEGAQVAAADAARARAQAIQSGIEGVGNTVQAGLSLVPLYQKQGAGARQAALSKTQYDDPTIQRIGNIAGQGQASEGFTNLDLDAVGQMSRRDYRAFEKSLTPQQRGLLFNADYYANLMPGGMGSFYNIGSGTAIGQ